MIVLKRDKIPKIVDCTEKYLLIINSILNVICSHLRVIAGCCRKLSTLKLIFIVEISVVIALGLMLIVPFPSGKKTIAYVCNIIIHILYLLRSQRCLLPKFDNLHTSSNSPVATQQISNVIMFTI